MKTLLLSILTVFSLIEVKADVITVKTTSVRYFNHTTGISTREAIESGAIKYFDYLVGKNTLVFDLDKKSLKINNQEPCAIIEIGKSNELVDCAIIDNGMKVYFTLGENETGNLCFVSKWEWEGKVNGYFATSSKKEFTFTLENEFRHLIDYEHFDNKFLERLVFKELNNYRDSLGVIDLLWSDEMYKHITCKQTEILAKGNSLYHPDLKIKFTNEFRVALAKESQRITGIKSYYNCAPTAVTTLSENGFSWTLEDVSYEKLAKIAIITWDRSFLHKCAQKYPYLEKGGGKGFVSISARLNIDRTMIFIFCNFSEVHKEIVELQTETQGMDYIFNSK